MQLGRLSVAPAARLAAPTEADGGTLVTITATDDADGISPEDHAAGMASSLDNLATFLRGSSGQ